MRTLRMIATTLMMVVLCLNFTACSDDDDDESPIPPTSENLIGTTWKGKDRYNYQYEVNIVSQSQVLLTIIDDEGYMTEQNTPLNYTYNETKGTITTEYEGDIFKVKITKTTMSLKVNGIYITLRKQ